MGAEVEAALPVAVMEMATVTMPPVGVHLAVRILGVASLLAALVGAPATHQGTSERPEALGVTRLPMK